MYYKKIMTPIGEVIAVATNEAVCMLEFADRTDIEGIISVYERFFGDKIVETTSKHPILDGLKNELSNYFKGTVTAFETPLMPIGTDFQKQVWQALQTIPYGETRSYGEIARMIDNPKGVRAVGLANSRNHIAIVVPCHRVIGANGTLTGYAGGLWRKEWLLAHEIKGKSVL